MSNNTATIERPEWSSALALSKETSISRSSIYELAASGKIRSSSFRERGKKKGKLLINTASLFAYIEKHASGGEESKA